jgi:hypothetical protein
VKLLETMSVQLSYPDYNKPFVWGNDTSLFATGSWLCNLGPAGELTLVAINDKLLTGEEIEESPSCHGGRRCLDQREGLPPPAAAEHQKYTPPGGLHVPTIYPRSSPALSLLWPCCWHHCPWSVLHTGLGRCSYIDNLKYI